MSQPYAVWLRGQIEACCDPFIRRVNMIPHVEDLVAICRKDLATADHCQAHILRQTIAGFEDILSDYATAA
ncbi:MULTISPECIES: hypothetical protein [unclassified Pseudomonas]|uniref:hypothetical protein n=1 Tax=unclassified Pseudomonas TaxID=196821 RepID=UPI00131AF0C5|nr:MULTISPECIES: hypothetical protein [unclassified Pseudomonas]